MSDNLIEQLSKKFGKSPKVSDTEIETHITSVMEEHLDSVAAAVNHVSSHTSDHSSSP